MKKFAIIAAAIFMSVALVLPAMAVEFDLGGNFRARGYHKSNPDSAKLDTVNANGEDTSADSYYDFRFRPVIGITLSDNIKVSTRVAVFNEKFGASTDARSLEGDGVGDIAKWDRAWMTYNTDNYGQFDIGRMKAGCFGLDVFDFETSLDRIKWTKKVNLNDNASLTMLAVIEKYAEGAGDDNTTLGVFERDTDAYAVAGIYKKDNLTAGLLIKSYRSESYGPAPGTDFPYLNLTTKKNFFVPYFTAQFGDAGQYGVQGEIKMATGSTEYKDGSVADIDYSGLGLYLAGTGSFGKTNVEVGIAMSSGDDPGTAEENEAIGGFGTEWIPLVILQDINNVLGAQASGGVEAHDPGVNLYYVSVDYALNDDITLTGMIAMASAAEVDEATGIDDSFGTEIDAKLKWKLTDALTYYVDFAYLMTGDYFKTATSDPDNVYTLGHRLQVDF
jgi:hypothetical protein